MQQIPSFTRTLYAVSKRVLKFASPISLGLGVRSCVQQSLSMCGFACTTSSRILKASTVSPSTIIEATRRMPSGRALIMGGCQTPMSCSVRRSLLELLCCIASPWVAMSSFQMFVLRNRRLVAWDIFTNGYRCPLPPPTTSIPIWIHLPASFPSGASPTTTRISASTNSTLRQVSHVSLEMR